MRKQIQIIFAVFMLVMLAGTGHADDIDIYYNDSAVLPESEPLVMFSLDWRPNLGSTACAGDECQFLIDGGYLAVQDSYTYFDLLRAVLRRVMDPLDGLRVGLMMNHDYKNNCAGDVSPGCSNGGYMALGAESFQLGDANGAKERFHEFLTNVPTPQGNASHKYQGKELFFEMFRYLTGQQVLNGHVGFLDYNGYPEDGSGGGDPDPDPDPGEDVTITVCETVKIKGTNTELCEDVTYNPVVEGYVCEVIKSGSNYNLVCTVSEIFGSASVALSASAEPSISLSASASSNSENLNVDNPSIAWDTSIQVDPTDETSTTNYISPLQAGGRCTKVFTVNVMFQVSQQEADSDSYIEDSIGNGGFGTEISDFPEMIEYLNDADLADGNYGSAANLAGTQNVTSYFLSDKSNTKTTGYAQAGGTGAALELSEDPEKLVATLEDVFKQILSVSTTFVSASVPVNAFNRAEVIDNVYLALFKADADGAPFWTGNVKKLKFDYLGDGSGDRQLVDSTGAYAVAADGRIRYDALTFWTDPDTLPPADADENEVDGKDGRATVRGGAGQKIPGQRTDGPDGPGFTNDYSGGRTLYYDWDGGLAPLNVDDDTASNLQTSLGAADATEAKALLAYARGLDVNDDDGDEVYSEAAEWFSGDPLHSRPLPINYGAVDGYDEDNQKIFIAYGSNDGFMHFVKNTESGGSESGEEVWAFMPKEVMGELDTLKLNASGSGHPYLVDGAPTAYVEGRFIDREIDGEDVFLYFCLRRGGKACYALDISEPESPQLLWTISKTGGLNENGSTDYAELGLTFSDPVVGLMSDGDDGETKPIVIFGGGYDENKDLRVGGGSDDSEGNAIFIVDGESGELIWKAVGSGASGAKKFVHTGLVNSVPSDVTAFDSDGDQVTDRVYVGDTGGRIWRADIGDESVSNWKLTLLADVGRHDSPGSKPDDRRFFHAPDVIQHFDENGPYDAVVIGSGDRPDPLAIDGVVDNFVYMIKDTYIASGAGTAIGMDHASFGDVTNTCLQSGGPCTADLTYGWKLGLSGSGEMSLATPLTIGGTSYFSTYLPPGSSTEATCGPDEGSGRLYAVSLENAEAIRDYDSTTEELERFDDLESKGIPSEAVSLPPDGILKPDLSIEKTETTTRLRTYWYEAEDGSL